jgi:hypothetical protein
MNTAQPKLSGECIGHGQLSASQLAKRAKGHQAEFGSRSWQATAGVFEEGGVHRAEEGTPQGGVVTA